MTTSGIYPIDVYIDSRYSDFPLTWSSTNARKIGSPDYVSKTFNNFTGHVIGFKVVEINVPFSYYVIDDDFTTLTFTYNAVTYNATISQGNYTPDELCLELQTKMNAVAVGSITSITYNIISNKLTFTGAGATLSISFNDTTNKFWGPVLGFPFQSTQSGTTLTSVQGINLAGDDVIYLCSTRISPHLNTSVYLNQGYTVPNLSSAICQIPVNVNRNESIQYANPQWFYQTIGATRIDSLDFFFCNSRGKVLTFNGLSFTLKLSFLGLERSVTSVENRYQSMFINTAPYYI